MRDLLRLFTPPEWPEWRPLARLAFAAVYLGIMIPVIWLAQKLGDWVVKLVFG